MQQSNPLAGRAFTGYPGSEERAYRAGTFLRAAIFDSGVAIEKCRELGIPLKLAEKRPPIGFLRAAGSSINSAGGYLAPSELEREILSLRDLVGVFRQHARLLPMGSDNRSWPRRTGGVTAQFVVTENGAISTSAATFDNVSFSAKKIAALVPVSSELFEDETVELAQWFAEEMAFAFASIEDGAGFAGDGTSTFGGIRGLTYLATDGSHTASKYTAASGHNTFATLDAVDIAGLIGILPEYAAAGAAFYVSNIGAANSFYRLAQNSGAIGTVTRNGITFASYLGFPIITTPKLPTATTTLTGQAMLLFGDLSLAAALGNRRGVTVQTTEDRYLDSDQIAVRGTERMDIVVHDAGDNSKAGPIVALVAP